MNACTLDISDQPTRKNVTNCVVIGNIVKY